MLWLSANGSGEAQAPPLPLLSTVNGPTSGDCGAVPLNGVRVVVVVAVPHVSGLASGASAPVLKCRIASLKGCSGFSEKVVVSWPVVSLGTTEPFRRTEIPYLVDSASR